MATDPTAGTTGTPPAAPDPAARLRAERELLLRNVEAVADPVMVVLGIAFVVLLVVQVAGVPLTPAELAFVGRADDAIYGAFVVDFLLRLWIVPDRFAYLKRNWLLVASLVLPALRPLRLVRLAPAVGSLHVAQLVGGANHGLSVLGAMLRGRAFLYLALLTLTVVLVGAVVVLPLEQGQPGTPLTSFGEALWWSATLVTTVNSGDDPVSGWGRVLAVLMRIYAVGVFGYLTGSIASYFVAQVNPSRTADPAPPAPATARPSSPPTASADPQQ